MGEVPVHFSKKLIHATVQDQNQKRRKLNDCFLRGLEGEIFSNKIVPIQQGEVPVIYSAGGMVPSMHLFQRQGGRIASMNFQHYLILKTGGEVHGDLTASYITPSVDYGNIILENPMENGSSTSRLFTAFDYIRILISHGSINDIHAGHNREGNPGFAQLAEIVAQYAKGGLNIINNEKGTLQLDNPEFEGLFEPHTKIFEKFVYQDEALVSSLDEAIELVNHDSGETLNKMIIDSNKQHSAYLRSLENIPKRTRSLIFVSAPPDNARIIKKNLNSKGIDNIIATDSINPEEDPISYIRLMDQCDMNIIYHSASINNENNILLPLAVSAYAVMTKKPTLYISEPLAIIKNIIFEFPEFGDRTRRIERVKEHPKERFSRMDAKDKFNAMRYLGPDFIEYAPFHKAYTPNEYGRIFHDAMQIANNLVLK